MKNMKATGIIRRMDELGRVVIPIELRRTMGLNERDAVEIYVDGGGIVLKKFHPACLFCASPEELADYKGKKICRHCLEELKNL